MKVRVIFYSAVAAVILGLGAPVLFRSQTNNYARLVAQAQADLKAGNAAQALAASQKAIKMDPRRWEAYVVAGGALEVEKHYTEAVEDFTRALDRAPSERKAAVKGLLEKCMKAQIAAQSPPVPAPSVPAHSQKRGSGPSYQDTVNWIAKAVAMAGVPAANGLRYSIQFDGCNTFTMFIANKDNNALHVTWLLDLDHVVFNEDPGPPSVVNILATGGTGYWHYSFRWNGRVTEYRGKLRPQAEFSPNFRKFSFGQLAYAGDDHSAPVLELPFGMPGTEELAPHVLKAFKHLVSVCKEHPEEAPKSLF